MKISVIIPVGRPGPDAIRSIEAILRQQTGVAYEVVVVTGEPFQLPADPKIRMVTIPEMNPAVRRNRGVTEASGDIVAFIDDDAFAEETWLETASKYLLEHDQVVALGGPDPAPLESPLNELISETLLATPFIGSGVLAHENRRVVKGIDAPFDLALVNLFIRTKSFHEVGGFDEAIGYVGEDTDLLERLRSRGRVIYHGGVIVRHRRRGFPSPFLRQRWTYRKKTGRLLMKRGSPYRRSPKILLFLIAGFLFLSTVVVIPGVSLWLVGIYSAVTLVLSLPVTRLPFWLWPLIPIFFLVHHATYFGGLLVGMVSAITSRGE